VAVSEVPPLPFVAMRFTLAGLLLPEGLDELPPAERNRVYKMMNLRVFAHPDDALIAEWGCNVSPLPRWSSTITTPDFKFRAVLTDEKSIEVELDRV
jgi:hypothetical protein